MQSKVSLSQDTWNGKCWNRQWALVLWLAAAWTLLNTLSNLGLTSAAVILGWQIDCNYSSEQTCWYVENFLLFFWLSSLSLQAKKLFLKCAGSQLLWKVSFDRSCHSPKLTQVPTAAIYTSLVSSYNSLVVRNMWMWNSKHWNQFIHIYIKRPSDHVKEK